MLGGNNDVRYRKGIQMEKLHIMEKVHFLHNEVNVGGCLKELHSKGVCNNDSKGVWKSQESTSMYIAKWY